ncbi:DR2241 family protein [Akkermansiaceae bacterium]|nr:DR2241 family protein [Akkermansiaceae bacterium]
MSLNTTFQEALESGIDQIGQLRILKDHASASFVLCHEHDLEKVSANRLDDLDSHNTPDGARELGLYTPEGEYRFTKGELTLPSGWIFLLENIADLRRAIDLFYPASLGLWNAWKNGTIRTQNLRDKLSRQTGMYRHSRNVSDDGAQHLIATLCGPANKCVKKILWQLDADTPLTDNEASRFNGILGKADDSQAIPLICQEACNFFVAECRKKSKKEFEESQS